MESNRRLTVGGLGRELIPRTPSHHRAPSTVYLSLQRGARTLHNLPHPHPLSILLRFPFPPLILVTYTYSLNRDVAPNNAFTRGQQAVDSRTLHRDPLIQRPSSAARGCRPVEVGHSAHVDPRRTHEGGGAGVRTDVHRYARDTQ